MCYWTGQNVRKSNGGRERRKDRLEPKEAPGKKPAGKQGKGKPWTPAKDADPRMKPGPDGESPLTWQTLFEEDESHTHGGVDVRDHLDEKATLPKRDW